MLEDKKIKLVLGYKEAITLAGILNFFIEGLDSYNIPKSERYAELGKVCSLVAFVVRLKKMTCVSKKKYTCNVPMHEIAAFADLHLKGKLFLMDDYDKIICNEILGLLDKTMV